MSTEAPALEWTEYENEHLFYLSNHPNGEAMVMQLEDGRWRWEAHANALVAMFDMDGWWGTAQKVEEAQEEAIAFLKRYPL